MKLKKENSMKINNKKLENAIVELTVAFQKKQNTSHGVFITSICLNLFTL